MEFGDSEAAGVGDKGNQKSVPLDFISLLLACYHFAAVSLSGRYHNNDNAKSPINQEVWGLNPFPKII